MCSTVQYIYVQRNVAKQAMVQLFVYTPLIRGLATRQNLPSLRNGSRHGEKAQSKTYQLATVYVADRARRAAETAAET